MLGKRDRDVKDNDEMNGKRMGWTPVFHPQEEPNSSARLILMRIRVDSKERERTIGDIKGFSHRSFILRGNPVLPRSSERSKFGLSRILRKFDGKERTRMGWTRMVW